MTARVYLVAACWMATGSAVASSPAAAVGAALADAKAMRGAGVVSKDLHRYRYFWCATREPKEAAYVRAVFRLHLNFLSRYPEMIDLVEVRPWLWRIDVKEIRWDPGTLEAARYVDPFFHRKKVADEDFLLRVYWPGGFDSRTREEFAKNVYRERIKAGDDYFVSSEWLPQKDIDELREVLHTEVPVLQAEWFMVQSCRQLSLANQQTGLGYYDFLRLRNRQDYFDLLKFREKDSLDLGKEVRAVAEFSRVSPAARQLVRLQAASGPVWVALDTNDPRGRGIALKNLERGAFTHQIEEWYGVLANGLPVTFLSDNNGVRQNNAPADAAGFGDDSLFNESRDKRIHVHLACLRCHGGQVLLPIKDYVRAVFRLPQALGVEDKDRLLDLRRQYFSNLDRALGRDRADYQDAFREATRTPVTPEGMAAQKAVEAYARVYHAYADRPVDMRRAAGELGVSEDFFARTLEHRLKKVKVLDLRLAPLTAGTPHPISRATWEDVYPLAQDYVAEYAIMTRVDPREGGK